MTRNGRGGLQAATEAEREAEEARRDKSIRLKTYHLKQVTQPPIPHACRPLPAPARTCVGRNDSPRP